MPCQFHVNDSILQMLGPRKRDQIGFINPLIDTHEEPYLYVKYSYRGTEEDLLIPESTPLQIPIFS